MRSSLVIAYVFSFALLGSLGSLGSLLWGCTPAAPSPGPLVESIQPPIVCDQQLTKMVRLGGENLTRETTGSLTLGTNLDGSPGSGAHQPLVGVQWMSPELLFFRVDPTLALAAGVYDVSATNADGQSHTAEQSLVVVDPPRIDSLAVTAACDTITITGVSLVAVGERFPTVAVIDAGGQTLLSQLVDPTSCLALPRRDTGVRVCTTLTLPVPAGMLSAGEHMVQVTNASDAPCQAMAPLVLIVDGAGCHS